LKVLSSQTGAWGPKTLLPFGDSNPPSCSGATLPVRADLRDCKIFFLVNFWYLHMYIIIQEKNCTHSFEVLLLILWQESFFL
jgi:hypothetical protein